MSDRTKSIRTAVPLLDAPDTGRLTAGRPGRHSPRAIQTGRPHAFDALLPVRPAPRDVLAQGVLYWDQIGSIVPSSFHLPDYLRQVADHGLYVPLEADRYVEEVTLQALVEQVSTLLRTIPADDLKLPEDPVGPPTRLHYGKLPYQLQEMLLRAGVLRDVETSYQAHVERGQLLTMEVDDWPAVYTFIG